MSTGRVQRSSIYFYVTLFLIIMGLICHCVTLFNSKWSGEHFLLSSWFYQNRDWGFLPNLLISWFLVPCILMIIEMLLVIILLCGSRNSCVKVFSSLIPFFSGTMLTSFLVFTAVYFTQIVAWIVINLLGIILYYIAGCLLIVGFTGRKQEETGEHARTEQDRVYKCQESNLQHSLVGVV